jgi:hypothetical protein
LASGVGPKPKFARLFAPALLNMCGDEHHVKMRLMREEILNEIRRLAAANGGQPPGVRAFENETGIRQSEWRGVYWARWSDAVAEAGLTANPMQQALNRDYTLEKLAQACRHFGKVPTFAEQRLYRRQVDPDFPNDKTVNRNFRGSELPERIREWVNGKEGFADVAALLPNDQITQTTTRDRGEKEGLVYLIRSGTHFKIGRSDELERRVKEITIALPEAATLVHAIRTDDPSGIEAYWHRRFADRRANGEWFKLTPADVSAFKRRKFQ